MTPSSARTRTGSSRRTLETATYDGKVWGADAQRGVPALQHRQGQEAPATWQEVYAQAAENGGIVFQGAPYEGLTCDWLELAFAAGGEVLSEDGTKA